MRTEGVSSPFGGAFPSRLAAAVVGAACFGLVAAPLVPGPFWPAAFVLAFVHGFVFLGGAGYRILLAVARRDARADTSVSWTGGAAASAVAACLAGVGLALAGLDAARLLAGFGVAANLSYAFAKLGCVEAGCCRAVRPLPLLGSADLRLVEIGASLATVALAGAALAAGRPEVAAVAGVGGHLGVRLASRLARDRHPRKIFSLAGTGQELTPLVLALALAIAVA